MINKELSLALNAIIKDAKIRRHEYLTAEHILYALIHDERGIDVITGCGGNVARLKESIEAFFEKRMPRLPENRNAHPTPALGFQRVVQRAVNHVHSAEKKK